MHTKVIIILISLFLFFSKATSNAYTEDDSKFRFAVMGCMHFGKSDPHDYEVAVERMKQYKPDFVLFLGGMVDASGEEPVESLWEEFDRISAKLGVPIYDVLGGDHPFFIPTNIDRMTSMEKCFLDRYKKRYYCFEHKNNLFICLDSNNLFDQERGLTTEDQLDFLKKTISDISKYNNVFIAMHKSAWISDFKDHSKRFDIVHSLIKGKVNSVFGAGLHAFNLKKLDGVSYITSAGPPGWLMQRESSFFHFLLVDVNKDKVSIKAVPILEDVEPIPIEDLESYEQEKFSWLEHEPSSERDFVFKPELVIEALKIKPGMSILDIGSGAGYFTFHLSEALKGTGKVFATEKNREKIQYIREEIKKGKFKNIFPIYVEAEGLDNFYKQHSFDIIFICDTYLHLRDIKDYFKELRPSLKEKTGRLYILQTRMDIGFSELDFKSFEKIIETIRIKTKDFPVFQRLSKKVQYFIKNWQGSDVPLRIQAEIIHDFNNILSDKLFYNDISKYYADREGLESIVKLLYSRDFELGKWLILCLEDEGTFDKKEEHITDIEKTQIRLLNRLILLGIFKNGINEEQLPKRRAGFTTYRLRIGKKSIISKMKADGYYFVREYDFLPQHYFLEFKREF